MKSTSHVTPVGDIKFMFAARPFKDKQTGEEKYTIKLEIDGSSAEGLALRQQLQSINAKKIVTNKVSKEGNFLVSFDTKFQIKVTDQDNNELSPDEVPFFDSRTDTGQASAVYKIIDYGNKQIIRLAGIRLMSLNLAEREDSQGASANEILELLKASK